MDKVTKARLQMATWVKENYPDLYVQAVEYAAAREGSPVSGLGEEKPSFWANFAEGLSTLATGVLAYKTQKAVLDTNLTRAQQGLAPISMEDAAPVVKTQIDLSPDVAARIQASAMEGTKNLLLYGGIAVAAFLLLKGRR